MACGIQEYSRMEKSACRLMSSLIHFNNSLLLTWLCRTTARHTRFTNSLQN